MAIIQSLFGDEAQASPRRNVQLRCLRTVFSTETVREGVPDYVATTRFTSPSQIFELFRDLEHETKEHFLALHLDGKNRIVCFERVSVGSLNQAIVHPREVYKGAVLSSAAALLVLHNHPRGDPTPSKEDLAITTRLREAGEIVGITLLDHIIVGAGKYCSFTEQGLR